MKNTNESGRSMVEMLGVLAIIGVLSIGGIAGYTLAMNRYRANEILNAAADVAIVAMSKDGGVGGNANLADLGGIEQLTIPAVTNGNNAIKGYANGVVEISLDNNYSDVGNIIASMSGGRMVSSGCDASNCAVNMQKAVKTRS